MRRLLLLLLTFLLPLQLLAATVGDVSAQRVIEAAGQACTGPAPAAGVLSEITSPAPEGQQALAAELPGHPPAGDDEPETSAVQADCEDHTLPAGLATPGLSWHPFPHAFDAPLHWSSFDRDQLRPPPLA